MASTAYLSIGAFSRLVGVSPDVLRAWERRYGLPRPARTGAGRRLYGPGDERLVRAMRRALADGHPAAEAARLAAITRAPEIVAPPTPELDALGLQLRDALNRFDDTAAQTVLDRVFGSYSVDTALAEVILPYLRELGERWAGREIGVGHEHFASNLLHGRLLSLARKWDQGHGPVALLACPEGERHTIGLLAFGLSLRMHGWRITYLGADTPIEAITDVAETISPAHIILASHNGDTYRHAAAGLAGLAARTPLAIAGTGADLNRAADIGAILLGGDPVTEAARVAWNETPHAGDRRPPTSVAADAQSVPAAADGLAGVPDARNALRQRARAEADRRLATAATGAARADLSWGSDQAGLEDHAVAVIATDLEGTIRVWNRAAERLYGWSAAAVLGRPITDVTVSPEDADVAQRIMASIRHSGSWEGEFWVRRRDGTRFLAFVRDVQITDAQDRPVAIIGFSVELATEPDATPTRMRDLASGPGTAQ